MIFEHRFTNQIIGIAPNSRAVTLNNIADRAPFELPEGSSSDFPVAIQKQGFREYWHGEFEWLTRWHDGSHWEFAGYLDALEKANANTVLGTHSIAACLPTKTQKSFPEGVGMREVVEDMRPVITNAIQDHLNHNVALVNEAIWRRTIEPSFVLSFSENATGKSMAAAIHPNKFDRRDGYVGQRFRIDDTDGLHEAIISFADKGWNLQGSNGIVWGLPDLEILIPESIEMEPEAQTILDLSASITNATRQRRTTMTDAELESHFHLSDTLERVGHLAKAYDEKEISDLLDAALSLRRLIRSADSGINSSSLSFAAECWENRPIGTPLTSLPPSSAVI